MGKKVLIFALVIAFALALTLSLGGCKDKEDMDDDFDTEWDDDDSWDINDDGLDFDEDEDNELVGFYDEGEWPDNEFTRQFPKPDFEVTESFLTDDEFSTTFIGMTVDDARKFSNQLQAAGFTINLSVYDVSTWDEVIRDDPELSDLSDEKIAEYIAELGLDDDEVGQTFNFEAENSAGYYLEFYWSDDLEVLLNITRM